MKHPTRFTRPDTHQCPGIPCDIQVPNALLACPTHWAVLSPQTKDMINATAHLLVLAPARREALAAARAEWRAAK